MNDDLEDEEALPNGAAADSGELNGAVDEGEELDDEDGGEAQPTPPKMNDADWGRSGFVAIVGRPSAGKSTLLNSICGEKVSIVSQVPQTTKNKIRGILTRGKDQLVFVDTPGYHDSDKKLNLRLKDLASSALDGADAVLYVVDSAREAGPEEEKVADLALGAKIPVFVAINKVDNPEADPKAAKEFVAARAEGRPSGAEAFEVSALESKGLEPLVAALFAAMPKGPLYYPEEFYTDQDPEFRIAEIVREQAINRVREELPHAIYVEIEDAVFEPGGAVLGVRANLCVERDSQKGMLIGKGASMIKAIREGAERELCKIFPYKVKLDLQVKVRKNWKQEEKLIKRLYN
jgi:GTPase